MVSKFLRSADIGALCVCVSHSVSKSLNFMIPLQGQDSLARVLANEDRASGR